MPEAIENQLSDEDRRSIEAHQMGVPLRIYKIKLVVILLMGGAGLCLLIFGAVLSIDLIMANLLGWHKAQIDDELIFPLLVGLAGFCFLAGLFLLGIEVPGMRKRQIIACEQGLLQISMKFRCRHVDAIYWEDIRTIKKFLGSYSYTIMCQGDDTFSLDILYQNVKELVALVETRKGKNTRSPKS